MWFIFIVAIVKMGAYSLLTLSRSFSLHIKRIFWEFYEGCILQPLKHLIAIFVVDRKNWPLSVQDFLFWQLYPCPDMRAYRSRRYDSCNPCGVDVIDIYLFAGPSLQMVQGFLCHLYCCVVHQQTQFKHINSIHSWRYWMYGFCGARIKNLHTLAGEIEQKTNTK